MRDRNELLIHLPYSWQENCGTVGAFTSDVVDEVTCPICLKNLGITRDGIDDTFGRADVRTFSTGATRSPLGTKPEYAGFLSPLVIKRFGAYMHKHRTQADGTIRDARNWQKGIPQAAYMDSMLRHQVDVWLYQEGHAGEMSEDIETALCAMIFNCQGMLYEILKEKHK
jgi:hypothetical protein